MINKLSDLKPRVVLRLRGVPDDVAMDALRQAYLRVCQETECWRAELPVQTIATDEDEYRLNPPSDAAIVRVKKIKIIDATQYADDQGDSCDPQDPTTYEILDDDIGTKIKLGSVPDSGMNDCYLRVWVAMVPAENSEMKDADANILQRWGSAVVHAAVFHLASTQGRPWSNMQEAALAEANYVNARRRILCEMDVTKLSGGPVLMAFPSEF